MSLFGLISITNWFDINKLDTKTIMYQQNEIENEFNIHLDVHLDSNTEWISDEANNYNNYLSLNFYTSWNSILDINTTFKKEDNLNLNKENIKLCLADAKYNNKTINDITINFNKCIYQTLTNKQVMFDKKSQAKKMINLFIIILAVLSISLLFNLIKL